MSSSKPAPLRVDVAVIGAGISGLRCAETLRRLRPDLSVVVLEANDRYIGGRMRTLEDLPGLAPLHLGAELVHGANTSLARLIDEQGWSSRRVPQWAHGDGGPTQHVVNGLRGYYYDGTTGTLLRNDSTCDPDFVRLNDLLWNVADLEEGPEPTEKTVPAGMTLDSYLERMGVPARLRELASISYANTLCSKGSLLPVLETADLEKVWGPEDTEDEDIKIDGSVRVVVEHLSRGVRCVKGWVAKSVEVAGTGGPGSAPNTRVTSVTGDIVECRIAVCAVPVSSYKNRAISFTPALDARRVSLLDRINFEPAMKIFLRFTAPFWPADAAGVVSAYTPACEFWFQPRLPAKNTVSDPAARCCGAQVPTDRARDPLFLVTCFACSDVARRLSAMGDAALVTTLLGQLDTIFASKGASPLPSGCNNCDNTCGKGKCNCRCSSNGDATGPATRVFHSHFAYDWAKAEHVGGGYSSPTAGVSMDDRDHLASPHAGGSVLFAGEHVARSYMAMHGAMDTGERAAKRVAESLAVRPRM